MGVYLKVFSETTPRRRKHFSCITKIHVTHSKNTSISWAKYFLKYILKKYFAPSHLIP